MKNYVYKKVFILSQQVPNYLKKWFLISTEANAFIAKYIINFSSEINHKKYNAHYHSKNVIYYHHLKSDLYYQNPNDAQAYKWCIRAMNQQFHYLRTPSHIMSRYYVLFKKIKVKKENEINKMCLEKLGISFSEIMIIGFCMYASILQNRVLNIRNLTNNTINSSKVKKVLTIDKINKFLNIYSIDVGNFKKEIQKWKISSSMLPLYKYEFNPLWSYPIIKTKIILEPDKKYIVPSLVDLVYAFSEGIYYKLMDKFRNKKGNLFSEKFGKIFQEYVGYLLSNINVKFKKCDEINSQNNPKPDYLIKENKKVIQIEVKKRILSNEARACVDDKLEKYIDKLVDDVYRQLFIPSKQHLNNTVYNLIVALDEWYYFEEKIKFIIENKLNEKAKKDKRDISKFRFHLLGCTDFEILCQFIKDNGEDCFFKLLQEKEKDQYYYKSFSTFLSERYSYQPSTLFINIEFDNFKKDIGVRT